MYNSREMGIQVPISTEVSGVTMHNLDTNNYSSMAQVFFQQIKDHSHEYSKIMRVASKLFPELTLLQQVCPDERDPGACLKYRVFDYECNREFCRLCLASNYAEECEEQIGSHNWMCPFCLGVCFCTRCTR